MVDNKKKIAIEVHDLTVSYDKRLILWNVSFSIQEGSFVAIVGPNGAAKTTLMKAMLSLLPSSSGYTRFYDMPLDSIRSKIAYIPQREKINWNFPLSVYDVVIMGRYNKMGWFKRANKEDRDATMKMLERTKICYLKDRPISSLSGGQKQLVFLARAMVQEATFYFMDEPFASIDVKTENLLFTILKELTVEGKTVLVIHHKLASIKKHFSWLLLINQRLIASGYVDDIFIPSLLKKTYAGQLDPLSILGEDIYLRREGIKPI